MLKRILASLLLFTLISKISAQSDTLNIREKRPFGLHLDVLGPAYVGSIGLDYFFSYRFSVEAGAGPVGYYFGGKLHPGNRQWKTIPYVGINHATIIFRGDDGDVFNYFYIPIGAQYVSKKGLDLSLEVALLLGDHAPFLGYAQFRIGYRFNKRSKKVKK